MIERYTLHNFKNHDTTEIPMQALTILTGVNGAGKSSIMQSMLVLRESSKNKLPEQLYLSGDSFVLGKSMSLLNAGATDNTDQMSINIHMTDHTDFLFEFNYPETSSSTLRATGNSCKLAGESLSQLVPLFSDRFQYLSANRIGPSESYSIDTSIVDDHRQLSQKMGQGEYTVYFLEKFGSEDIPCTSLAYPGVEDLSLSRQVEAWLTEISDGVRIRIDTVGDRLELKFGYSRQDKPALYYSANNSGYGLSYVLSIITAILSAKEDSLILIENPEAHIHPHGQSALMRLIGLAAKCGIQVLMETHSDHIVNGALVSGKTILGRENLSIIYFTKDEQLNAQPHILEIESHGRIINAPDGFCDQMELDLDTLFSLSDGKE